MVLWNAGTEVLKSVGSKARWVARAQLEREGGLELEVLGGNRSEAFYGAGGKSLDKCQCLWRLAFSPVTSHRTMPFSPTNSLISRGLCKGTLTHILMGTESSLFPQSPWHLKVIKKGQWLFFLYALQGQSLMSCVGQAFVAGGRGRREGRGGRRGGELGHLRSQEMVQ